MIFPRLQVTVVFPTPPLKLITAIDLGLMAGFFGILLKYKLKHIVAVSRSRDRDPKFAKLQYKHIEFNINNVHELIYIPKKI